MKRFKPVHSQYMASYPLCSTHTFSFPPSNNHISIFSSSGEKKKDHISMLKPVKTSQCWGENCCVLVAELEERRLGYCVIKLNCSVKSLKSRSRTKQERESPHLLCPPALSKVLIDLRAYCATIVHFKWAKHQDTRSSLWSSWSAQENLNH